MLYRQASRSRIPARTLATDSRRVILENSQRIGNIAIESELVYKCFISVLLVADLSI